MEYPVCCPTFYYQQHHYITASLVNFCSKRLEIAIHVRGCRAPMVDVLQWESNQDLLHQRDVSYPPWHHHSHRGVFRQSIIRIINAGQSPLHLLAAKKGHCMSLIINSSSVCASSASC